jgi:hypothetical protein
MSTMNAMRGRIFAMYVKFCSGPTPTYAPPPTPNSWKPETTCRYEVSFDVKLSEWKNPPARTTLAPGPRTPPW